jgi:PleD family two-component response regulator
MAVAGHEGQTLVQTLRAAGANAICIATSPDPSPDVRQRWRVAGAALCLTKPVNPAILGAIARQLVTQGHLPDPLGIRSTPS